MTNSTDHHVISFTTAADSAFSPLTGGSTSQATKKIAGHRLTNKPKNSAPNVEKAIFAHIRAMRTLGHKTVNTRDVARALDLPLAMVDGAIAGLNAKGVRVAK